MENWLPPLNLATFNAYGWFVLIVVLERLFPTRKTAMLNKGWYWDVLHTYEPYLRAFTVGGIATLLTPYATMMPGHWFLTTQPVWVNVLALVLISEVTFYVMHRWMHASPWLWEFHRVHHSSTAYYSFMTSRFHILDILLFSVPYVFLVSWTGVRPEVVMGFAVFQGFMDRYGHSNVRGPRFTGYVLGSPHFHAWHHSNEPEAHDKNFSRDFVFMDYLFGTAYDPRDKVADNFGDKNYPVNYFVQQAWPLVTLSRRLAKRPDGTADPTADELASHR